MAQIEQSRILYRCKCEEAFTGSFQQVQGHKGRKKHPECSEAPDIVLPDDVEDEVLQLAMARDASGEEEPGSDDVLGDLTDNLTLAESGRGRRPAARFNDPNGRQPGKARTQGLASSVRSTLDLPVYLYVMYDGWRTHYQFSGSFNDFIVESLLDYFSCFGFKLDLIREDYIAEQIAAGSGPPANNGHVPEMVGAANG